MHFYKSWQQYCFWYTCILPLSGCKIYVDMRKLLIGIGGDNIPSPVKKLSIWLISWEWYVVIPLFSLGVFLSIEHLVFPLISTFLFDSWYDTCKIWTIFKKIMRYFCQIRNMPYWVINVRGSTVVPLLICASARSESILCPALILKSHWPHSERRPFRQWLANSSCDVASMQIWQSLWGMGTIHVLPRGQLGCVDEEDNDAACGGFERGVHGDRTRAC